MLDSERVRSYELPARKKVEVVEQVVEGLVMTVVVEEEQLDRVEREVVEVVEQEGEVRTAWAVWEGMNTSRR